MSRWPLLLLQAALTGWLLHPALAAGQESEPPSGARIESSISYSRFGQTVLDLYLPSGASNRRCGVLTIHGGGWEQGSRNAVVQTLVYPWLRQGCVVANIDYRLSSAAPAPAAVEDVLHAAAWFADNARRYGVDRRHIVATGFSAGAHLALMAALTPKSAKLGPTGKIAMVVNFSGVTDVEDQLGGENMQDYAVKWVPAGQGRMELARRVSPASYLRKKVPSILTIHGTADQTVPYDHGIRLTKALRDLGADAEMISVPNGEHDLTPQQMETVWPQVFEFARRRKMFGKR